MGRQGVEVEALDTDTGPLGPESERRCVPRLRCNGSAEVYLASAQPYRCARLLNLSQQGCRLELAEPCEVVPGCAVEVAFIVNQLPFRLRAEVRTVVARKTLGISFLNLSARSALNLQELVYELVDRHEPLV